jgi:glycine betaine/proline transport system ATP-binding protein
MQQRVGLARALCADAEILLMDEAFSALDPLIRGEMQDLLMKLQDRLKKTIVFITHDLDEALRLGDRIAILRDGTLSQVGTPAEILLTPADSYVRAFVKDVNRARVLTVATVMKPPPLRLTDETLEEALAAMQREGAKVGYVVGAAGYRGVVTRDALDAAIAGPHVADIGDIVMDAPAIDSGASLAEALPRTLSSAYPVAVVDAKGGLAGVLSTDRVGEIFTLPAEDGEPEDETAPVSGAAERK